MCELSVKCLFPLNANLGLILLNFVLYLKFKMQWSDIPVNKVLTLLILPIQFGYMWSILQ